MPNPDLYNRLYRLWTSAYWTLGSGHLSTEVSGYIPPRLLVLKRKESCYLTSLFTVVIVRVRDMVSAFD